MRYTQEQLERQLGLYLSDVCRHGSSTDDELAATGMTQVDGRPLEILVRYAADTRTLPEIRCMTPLEGVNPHVGICGTICYFSGPVAIDYTQPDAVVAKSLLQALEKLAKALVDDPLDGILSEFMHHWGLMDPAPPAPSILCAVEPKPDVYEVQSYFSPCGSLKLVSDGTLAVERIHVQEPLVAKPAIYVGLRSLRSFPRAAQKWTAELFRRFIDDNLDRSSRRRLKRLTKKLGRVPCVLGVPRGDDTWAMVGHDPTGSEVQDWLGDTVHGTRPPRFFTVQRLDRSSLLPRGGANKGLADCRVMIVGCGAIGSRVAEFMAASGIGFLQLIDFDTLSVDNTYRHLLGLRWMGRPKSLVLKVLLEQRFPYLQVEASFEKLKPSDITGAKLDIIIFATGDPCVERPLNMRLQEGHDSVPHIYTWLEPLGVGGHTAVVVPGFQGCLECLYSDPSESSLLRNRTAFVGDSTHEDLFLNLDGCGGGHTPFSDLDAVKTAELTCRLALKTLAEPSPILASWRGKLSEYEFRGLPLSPRFRSPEDMLQLDGPHFYSPNCPVCALLDAAV